MNKSKELKKLNRIEKIGEIIFFILLLSTSFLAHERETPRMSPAALKESDMRLLFLTLVLLITALLCLGILTKPYHSFLSSMEKRIEELENAD